MSNIEILNRGILDLDTEIIVNAANEELFMGSGVCGVIFNAAGPKKLEKACRKIDFCKTGDAVITPSFDFKKAKYIVHAVGPVYFDGKHNEDKLLYSAYYNSLTLAREYKAHSIGFPLISAGIFGYPLEDAIKIGIKACTGFLNDNPDYDITIRFGIPSERNYNLMINALNELRKG